MGRTPDQRAADELMNRAVDAAARAYGFVFDGATIIDFITVVEAIQYDDDPETFQEYRGVLYRDGSTRASVAIGLLRIGEQMVGEDASMPLDGG